MSLSSAFNTIGSKNRFKLMIAEDDLDDQLLFQDALELNGLSPQHIIFAKDGEELLEMLSDDTINPSVILMDLNMPRKDGREALREIKLSDGLRHIPVIVFTTSSSDEDVWLTYQHGANSFFTKPKTFDGLVDVFALLKKYWMEETILATSQKY